MALANIAVLLCQAGLNVLMVDWDLEAPGLERFFPNVDDQTQNRRGLMNMLLGYQSRMTNDLINENEGLPFEHVKDFAVDIYQSTPKKTKLQLITAGQRGTGYYADYARAVQAFDWRDFYLTWGGELYFEWLRQQFRDSADITLIDARTGITDMGSVCLYQLADLAVMFCSPNQENLNGTRFILEQLTRSEVLEARGRPLQTLVVASRIEDTEISVVNRFAQEFTEYFSEFIPENLVDTLCELKIPFVPYYSFREATVALEQEEPLAYPLLESYRRLSNVILSLASEDIQRYAAVSGESGLISDAYEGDIVSKAAELSEMPDQEELPAGETLLIEALADQFVEYGFYLTPKHWQSFLAKEEEYIRPGDNSWLFSQGGVGNIAKYVNELGIEDPNDIGVFVHSCISELDTGYNDGELFQEFAVFRKSKMAALLGQIMEGKTEAGKTDIPALLVYYLNNSFGTVDRVATTTLPLEWSMSVVDAETGKYNLKVNVPSKVWDGLH